MPGRAFAYADRSSDGDGGTITDTNGAFTDTHAGYGRDADADRYANTRANGTAR